MAVAVGVSADAARGGGPRQGRVAAGRVPPRPRGALAGWAAAVGVTLVAFGLRAWHVASVPGTIFDEVYYAADSWSLLRHGVELKPDGSPSFVVHPPLGKWCIALGEAAFGNHELGWRAAPVVAGTLTVLVVTRVARRLTGSTLLGCVAGLLMAVDGLAVVQSRTSMLDVFLALFVVAGFGCLVLDREAGRLRLAAESGGASGAAGPARRGWRLAAGALLGAAVATKWSAAFVLAVVPVLCLAWDAGARRRAGAARPVRAALRRDLPSALVAFVGVPLVVYAASWSGWFLTDGGWDRHWADTHPGGVLPGVLRSWLHYHREVLTFHSGLSSSHPYQSRPGSWLVLGRPVLYYYASIKAGQPGCTSAGGCSREVLAIGNPVLWWSTVPVLALTAWGWLTRRDWRCGALLALWLAGFLPWVYYDLTDRRTEFLFYALPSLPFLVLAATLLVGRATSGRVAPGHPGFAPPRRPRAAPVLAGAWLLAVVALLVVQEPILLGETIPYRQWSALMWFHSWI